MASEFTLLADYAHYTLRRMCLQPWVKEKCLKFTRELFKVDMLLDPLLKPEQAQKLVHCICHDDGEPPPWIPIKMEDDDSFRLPEQCRQITSILQHANLWSLRTAYLELTLLIKQASSGKQRQIEREHETNILLDNISKGALAVFQQDALKSLLSTPESSFKHEGSTLSIVAPLFEKMPSSLQGRFIKHSKEALESGNLFWQLGAKTRDRERSLQKSTLLLKSQGFVSTLLTCLKTDEVDRGSLLNCLHTQLEKFVTDAKQQDPQKKISNDPNMWALMEEALKYRLSLAGGMFDVIQESHSTIQDWAVLLMQLLAHGVVDYYNNTTGYTSCLDMLTALTHSSLIYDEENKEKEENRRQFGGLMKKLKATLAKEVGDRQSEPLKHIRQLLLHGKPSLDVIAVEPYSAVLDSKRHVTHNASKGTYVRELMDGLKEGYQVASKQKVTPSEIMGGTRNPAPLAWSYFGATRVERQPMEYEEQQRKLLYHTHSFQKSSSYFLEPIPLPPEDLEPVSETQEPKEPVRVEQPALSSDPDRAGGPSGGGTGGGKKKRSAKRSRPNARPSGGNTPSSPFGMPGGMTSPMFQPADPFVRPQRPNWPNYAPGGAGGGGMPPNPQNQPGFAYNQGQPHAQGMPNQPYGGGGPGPGIAKQALNNMLRQRRDPVAAVPGSYMAPNAPANPNIPANVMTQQHNLSRIHQQKIIRDRIHQRGHMGAAAGMPQNQMMTSAPQGNQMYNPGINASQHLTQMSQQQQQQQQQQQHQQQPPNLTAYQGFGPPPTAMEQRPGMAGYPSGQNPTMLGQPGQTGYNRGGGGQQSQFISQQQPFHGSRFVNPSPGPAFSQMNQQMGQMNQGQMSQGQAGQGYASQAMQPQHRMQQMMDRRQMAAPMQQQQQQQQPMMNPLQRQMSGGGQGYSQQGFQQ